MAPVLSEETLATTDLDRKERFRALVVEQLPRLYAIARRLCREDADDVVQDCLLKGFRSFAQLRDEAAGGAWLVSVLVNCCRDRLRARARKPEEVDVEEMERFSLFRKIADEDPFPYSDSLHLDFLQRFGREDVHAVLAALPPGYRIPLVLVHMDGFSVKEVARMVGAPVGTVLARLHRGRKLFEKRMWDYAEANGLLREEGR